MPTGAGFGVGAVVSILHKNLKPRNAVAQLFPNDRELGRTNDFVVQSLGEEGGREARRATVSSPTVLLQGAQVVFNVAWGSCKIVTAAPEDARVQVKRRHWLILSLFERVFHVYRRLHLARVANPL